MGYDIIMGEDSLSADEAKPVRKKTLNNLVAWDLLEDLPVAVYTCDKDGYITSFNKAAVKLWGKTPETGSTLYFESPINISF